MPLQLWHAVRSPSASWPGSHLLHCVRSLLTTRGSGQSRHDSPDSEYVSPAHWTQSDLASFGIDPPLHAMHSPTPADPATQGEHDVLLSSGEVQLYSPGEHGCVPTPHSLHSPPKPADFAGHASQDALCWFGCVPAAQVSQTPPVPAAPCPQSSHMLRSNEGALPAVHMVHVPPVPALTSLHC